MERSGDNARDWTPVVERCFVCGTSNPQSLGLRPYRSEGRVVADFTPSRDHRGYSHVVHGGIACAVLDEVMGAAVSLSTTRFMATVEIRVRYLRPFLVETRARVEGWLEKMDGRRAIARGRILDESGREIVEAEATFVALSADKLGQFLARPAEPAAEGAPGPERP